MRTISEARDLLYKANVFFDAEGEEWEEDDGPKQMLNMNDTWCWACAEGEVVKDEELPELARLFWWYGNGGLMYWYSEKNQQMRSEFEDNNRAVDFVRHEENLRKAEPSSSKRAYKRIKYTLGRDTPKQWWRRKKRQWFFKKIRIKNKLKAWFK